MPRTATAASQTHDDEATMTHVDELIQRGRSQGHLSLPELREAFEQARMSPTEARSIIRELTEAGVQLGNDQPEASCRLPPSPRPHLRPAGGRAQGPRRDCGRSAGTAPTGAGTAGRRRDRRGDRARRARPAEAAVTAQAEATTLAAGRLDQSETDLDDQTSVMGDSVHTYLKSIGRTSLLTAEQEVDLAKRIEAGLFAEHKLETESKLSEELRARPGGRRRGRPPGQGAHARGEPAPGGLGRQEVQRPRACPCSTSCRRATWA